MPKAEVLLLIEFSILLCPVKFCWSKWKSLLLLMVWSWSPKDRIGSAELMASLSSGPQASWIRHSQPENCSNQLLNPDSSFPLDVQFFQDIIGIEGIHFSSLFISFLLPDAPPCPLDCDGSPAPCPKVLCHLNQEITHCTLCNWIPNSLLWRWRWNRSLGWLRSMT